MRSPVVGVMVVEGGGEEVGGGGWGLKWGKRWVADEQVGKICSVPIDENKDNKVGKKKE